MLTNECRKIILKRNGKDVNSWYMTHGLIYGIAYLAFAAMVSYSVANIWSVT